MVGYRLCKTGGRLLFFAGNLEWSVETMNLVLELFGYLGTALVVISMMMTSVTRLRIVNMSGAVICAIYGAFTGTWPTMVLNLSLIAIHIMKLMRTRTMQA
jgi:hypothetical protein